MQRWFEIGGLLSGDGDVFRNAFLRHHVGALNSANPWHRYLMRPLDRIFTL
jgi:hypothetical protein